jgi:hypothetical protein
MKEHTQNFSFTNQLISRVILVFGFCFILSAYADEKPNKKDSVKSTDIGKSVELLVFKKRSFNPSRNEQFTLPFKVDTAKVKKIEVEIRTHENDLIRHLELTNLEKDKELYELKWDGRDQQGMAVPDEAYRPVILVTDKQGKQTVYDSVRTSGGEEVYDFEKKIVDKAIEYTLPVDSRVLIRSGIKNGPMLSTIVDWEPRSRGFHVERWTGRDADDVLSIDQFPDVAYLILGYQLPDNSIITYGNKSLSYRKYREQKGLPVVKADYDDRLLERNDKLIRTEFFTPVLQQKSPRIRVMLNSKVPENSTNNVNEFEEIITAVKLNPLDEVYLDQERYEINFFVDNDFLAEEEQGFVPFNWRWSPTRYGLRPGNHMLTVNVSGYSGQVGVKHIPFSIEEKAE